MPQYHVFVLFHVFYFHAFCKCLYICVFYITVLKTILSLMPTTSYPKGIGGVCYGTITGTFRDTN